MNRSRLLLIGLVAVALGGLLSFSVYRTLQARTASPRQVGVDVVVAATDIQVGAKIEDRDVKIVKLPAEDLPANVFRGKTHVVGRGVVLPVSKGEFILPNKLAAENAGSGMPALIPPGMRAVSVRVNEVVSVAGFVMPGTRVDVLLTGNPLGSSESQTTTVLENIAVLAAGQKLERNTAGEPQTVPVITLLVSPEDAQKLTLASQEGKIQLALRNPLDTIQQRLPSVRNTNLYTGLAPAPTPAVMKAPKIRRAPTNQPPPAPPVYSIEVIRGPKKDTVKFDH
ncbi:MAG TPA: Flp pilus assembly protein CpaB [Terriglobales bacterium]|nr:Flp pilus assembly protein CpaB [Terriglobales bacterium]